MLGTREVLIGSYFYMFGTSEKLDELICACLIISNLHTNLFN